MTSRRLFESARLKCNPHVGSKLGYCDQRVTLPRGAKSQKRLRLCNSLVKHNYFGFVQPDAGVGE
jgi:hypothetical protein